MTPFGRPALDVRGRVVARRACTIGDRTYQPGQEMAVADREQLADRQIAMLWQQGVIDTPAASEPSDAELERLTAPSRPATAKSQRR